MKLASVRAAVRLSPRQVAYHLKRKGRNAFAEHFPGAYASRIEWVARRIPPLSLSAAADRCTGADLAKVVSPFYVEEYRNAIDDAARGKFSFFRQEVNFGGPDTIDWHREIEAESDFHLWRMKLAHMGFICPMLLHGDERHLSAVSEILASYKRDADFGVSGCFTSYWFPYSVSHRVLAILSGYVHSSEGRGLPPALQNEIEAFLRWNVAFILDNIEHELRNNHVERNLAALCLYFSYAQTVPKRIGRRLDREVRRVIEACVLPDGLIAERSAMYQGLSVMALDVFSRTPFLSDTTRGMARSSHRMAQRAWLTMTHPDGEIALFNDSWFEEVPKPADIIGHTGVVPAELLPDAGYARLEADGVFVLMDAGPIGPRWNPGHGHADFLAVEADIAGKRFIVDPGTFQYSSGPRRAFERSAQSHNGPTRRGVEPVEYFGCFRVGRMNRAEIASYEKNSDGGTVVGQLTLIDGSAVQRSISVIAGLIRFTDEWTQDAAGARVGLTIPEEWIIDHQSARHLSFRNGADRAEIRVSAGRFSSVRSGEWSCHYLESKPATIVELEPDTSMTGTNRVSWEVLAASQALSEPVEI